MALLRKKPNLRASLAIATAILLLSACAAQRMQKEGLELINAGNYEAGIAKLDAATKEEPRDPTYRMSLANSRESIAMKLLATADRANSDGNTQEAEAAYRRVLAIDANNQRAIDGLRSTAQQKNIDEFIKTGQAALKKNDLEAAQKAADSALLLNGKHPGAKALRKQVDEAKLKELPLNPQVKSKFAKPVSLEFRDANLKMVFDVLARTSGINFVFDKEVKSDIKVTIFVKQVAVEDAIDLLLMQSQLEKKVINESSVLIYPNTPQKLKEFQDLTVKSFYITNADVKQTQNMLKTILKTKDIFIDEKLNLLIMRDTPDAIRIAEKLIASQDLAEPEVVLEIEVLELNRNKLLDVGIQWPSQLSSPLPTTPVLRPGTGATAVTSSGTVSGADNPPIFDPPINNLKTLRQSLAISGFVVDRGVVIKLANTDADSRQLASPRIRVRSKEKAKIHIGDKVPVVTATISAAAAGASAIVTDNIVYLDVGIKLEVEPVVYLNDEVAIKLNLDVSSATTLAATKNGSVPVQVSTRSATTLLRLKDGETQALAGLIQNNRSVSRDKIPGLGDVPFFGHLFSTNRSDDRDTELVLLVTPRVVRNLQRADVGLAESYSGTEGSLRSKQFLTRPTGEAEGVPLKGAPADVRSSPVITPAPAAAPARADQTPEAASANGLAVVWEGPTDLKVGEESTVLLRVKADQPLLSTALQIGFDPAAVKIVEAAEGDLLKQDGAQTTFSTRVDESAGRLFVGLARPGPSGTSGEGSLLRLRIAGVAAKEKSPLRVVVFSGIGPGNRLLQAALPAPVEITVAP